jgi:hypothetical protein
MYREGEALIVHQAAFRHHSIKHSCRVLGDVEFLVTSGIMIFMTGQEDIEGLCTVLADKMNNLGIRVKGFGRQF